MKLLEILSTQNLGLPRRTVRESLQARYELFRLALEHNRAALQHMAELEQIYYSDHPIDARTIRRSLACLQAHVLGLADGLNALCADRFAELPAVCRAIDAEIKRHGLDYVHLDISHQPADFVTGHFPTIHEKLLGLGIEMTREPIPVVPAQHYTCGGVLVDLAARTDLPGLWAAGECTESGLHGANRLASNSLLECFVFGEASARDILASWDDLGPPPAIRPWDESRVADSDEEVVIKQNWTEIRRFMWNYVGIVRTTKRLQRAAHRIALLGREIDDYYGAFRVTTDLIELRNLHQAADLIVQSALRRRESRGLHFTLDYPQTAPVAVDTVLVP